MKIDIRDLLDEYTPDTKYFDEGKNGDLRAVNKLVLNRLKGEKKMVTKRKKRTIFALAVVAALALGTVSVNAATDGALVKNVSNTITAWFINEDGTKTKMQLEPDGEIQNADGTTSYKYHVSDTDIQVTKNDEADTTGIEVTGEQSETSVTAKGNPDINVATNEGDGEVTNETCVTITDENGEPVTSSVDIG